MEGSLNWFDFAFIKEVLCLLTYIFYIDVNIEDL